MLCVRDVTIIHIDIVHNYCISVSFRLSRKTRTVMSPTVLNGHGSMDTCSGFQLFLDDVSEGETHQALQNSMIETYHPNDIDIIYRKKFKHVVASKLKVCDFRICFVLCLLSLYLLL